MKYILVAILAITLFSCEKDLTLVEYDALEFDVEHTIDYDAKIKVEAYPGFNIVLTKTVGSVTTIDTLGSYVNIIADVYMYKFGGAYIIDIEKGTKIKVSPANDKYGFYVTKPDE